VLVVLFFYVGVFLYVFWYGYVKFVCPVYDVVYACFWGDPFFGGCVPFDSGDVFELVYFEGFVGEGDYEFVGF